MRYWIGLGSNLGDRLANLRNAATALGSYGVVLARSRIYAASPVGGPPQPPFLNAAVILESDLDSAQLLEKCQSIETDFGRGAEERAVRWGPRTLDVDILLMGQRGEIVHSTPALEVPHPRLHERAFALAPLLDLDPQLMHATLGRLLTKLLDATQQQGHAFAPTGDAL